MNAEHEKNNTFRFQASPLARLVRAGGIKVEVNAYRLAMSLISSTETITIPLVDIAADEPQRGLFWAAVQLSGNWNGAPLAVKATGLGREQANRLHALVSLLSNWDPDAKPKLAALHSRQLRTLAQGGYISKRELKAAFARGAPAERELTQAVGAALKLNITNVLGLDLPAAQRALDPASHEPARHQRNQDYIRNAKQELQSFFKLIEKAPLSDEQQTAVLTDEDRNLVVAAAGSGKTSTIVGKVAHWILSGRYQPREVLTLAFGKDAAKELGTRIGAMQKRLMPGAERIEASTFHRFGMGVVKEVLGQEMLVCEDADKVIFEVIGSLRQQDAVFALDWVNFVTLYLRPVKAATEFGSLAEYKAYLKACGADERGRLRALNGSQVASMEELAISNFLTLKGVKFQYERPYPINTASEKYRQYCPDFYYPEADLYHEHFGVDENGRPAPFLGEKYLQGLAWKRELHAKNKTKLIETTSGMFRSGEIYSQLEKLLLENGVSMKPLDPQEVEKCLARLDNLKNGPERLVSVFLHHLKSNHLTPDQVGAKLGKGSGARERLFLSVIGRVWNEYEETLRSRNEVDFDDMINLAADFIEAGRVRVEAKAVIVDEYQDISRSRARLVRAILGQHDNSRLMAVGDDWQAIYRFAGSDVDLMTRFDQHLGEAAVTALTKTFRCNDGIAQVAAAFIQRNPGQIKKAVVAHDPEAQNSIKIHLHQFAEAPPGDIDRILSEILIERPGAKVFFLGRYKSDEQKVSFKEVKERYKGRLELFFHTLHKSKGLEADYVVLLGMTEGSFPAKAVDDPLLSLVMPAWESFPDAEERRLFYVGLTRAKHRVYLLGRAGKESKFLSEIRAILPAANLETAA